MSLTGQTISSTSNIQLIIDALADYAKLTGIDLSKDPFAATLEQSNSPGAILQQFQEREKNFKEYRDDNRRLISCLSPIVKVFQAFSWISGEAVSLVSDTPSGEYIFNAILSGPHPASKRFVCWDRYSPCCTSFESLFEQFPCLKVFQAASGITSSYDAVLDLFECLENFVKHLEIYTTTLLTTVVTDTVLKIMVELLSVLALATKQVEEGRFSECAVT
jgi:hypothetical protein